MEGPWKLVGEKEKLSGLFHLSEAQPERTNHLVQQPKRAAGLLEKHREWLAEVQASRKNRR